MDNASTATPGGVQKTSKVKKIDFKKEHTNSFGTTYYFIIAFDNGDTGEFSSKKREQDKFKEGQVHNYLIEQRGQYFDVKKPDNRTSGGPGQGGHWDPSAERLRQLLIVRQNALTNAVVLIDRVEAEGEKKIKSDAVLALADKLFNWTIGPYKNKLELQAGEAKQG